jgi:hypothetical protein
MLLVLEIVLTVWAWRKGWKAWSLLPLGIVAGVGFIIGFMGVNLDQIGVIGTLFDLSAITALIVIVAKGRQVEPKISNVIQTGV